jgi:transcription antitermination protein NusB
MLYQRDVTGASLDEIAAREGSETPPFARELAEGVEAERERLDRLIGEHAHGWDVERIAPLERAILRVALYEILCRPDIPDEVAIDEAVETAKLYCGKDAPGFINGILGSVTRDLARSGKEGS